MVRHFFNSKNCIFCFHNLYNLHSIQFIWCPLCLHFMNPFYLSPYPYTHIHRRIGQRNMKDDKKHRKTKVEFEMNAFCFSIHVYCSSFMWSFLYKILQILLLWIFNYNHFGSNVLFLWICKRLISSGKKIIIFNDRCLNPNESKSLISLCRFLVFGTNCVIVITTLVSTLSDASVSA